SSLAESFLPQPDLHYFEQGTPVIRPKRTAHRRASLKGQSLVEMALILPVLLAVAGGATDLSRAYAAWTSLESATRNAAEYVATNSPDAATAITDAKRVVCAE